MPAAPSYLTILDRDRRLPSCHLYLAAFRAFRYLEHAKYLDLENFVSGRVNLVFGNLLRPPT